MSRQSTNIYMTNGINEITFEGVTKSIPRKTRFKQRETIDGETAERYVTRAYRVEIEIQNITQDQYETLEEMFYSTDKTKVITDRGERFRMRFTGEELDLNYDTDFESKIFWYGNIGMKE